MLIKQIRALVIAAVLLVLLSGTVGAYAGQQTRVRISNGVETTRYVTTTTETVGEVLAEENIVLGEFDVVEPSLETALRDSMMITISRAFPIQVKIDNAEPIEAFATGVKLYEFANIYGKQTGLRYTYNTSEWTQVIEPGQVVQLYIRQFTMEKRLASIPFTILRVESDVLSIGEEEVVVQGRVGTKNMTYEVEMENGKEIKRTLVSETIEELPVTRVILVGTADNDPNKMPVFDYTEVRTMSTTAYTSDYASTGKRPGDKGFGICATGITAQYGVVAVDPKVIPLYTKLYIEGYGFAIAGDTGGAIKGEVIDIYLDTTAEARAFGRQKRQVYILADQNFDLGIDLYAR